MTERSAAEVAVQSGALVVVERERGILAVSGSERASWLNAVVTPDASAVNAERAGFGLFLSKQGKIQTDFLLVAEPERLLLVVAPGTADATRAELDRMLVMEDVELSDASVDLVALSLHGPRAVDLARAAAGNAGGAFGELDRTGHGGAVLLVRRDAEGAVTRDLEAASALFATGDDWLSVRVPAGVGDFGIDFGPADNPHEAGLDRRAISWSKGCYLGQEAVFMQDARGKVKRRLVVLAVDGSEAALPGEPIARPSGEPVGQVTSAAVGHGGRFVLGKVSAPDFELGSELLVGRAPARVVAQAFAVGAPADAPAARQTV